MFKRAAGKIKQDNENEARKDVLENMFYDFNRSRKEVYWINFWRGIFFGIGSVMGGTLIVALVVWILTLLVDLPGGVGDFIQYVVDTVRTKQP
jgi:hypothetical protein